MWGEPNGRSGLPGSLMAPTCVREKARAPASHFPLRAAGFSLPFPEPRPVLLYGALDFDCTYYPAVTVLGVERKL